MLLDVMTCVRRADGREVSLREFPMAELLSVGRDAAGRGDRPERPRRTDASAVLLNATPVLSDEGKRCESCGRHHAGHDADVEEPERLRAEFLAMVSHELRSPLVSIKGSAATVLESPTDLDPAVVRQFFRLIGEQADHMHHLVSDLLDVARIETGDAGSQSRTGGGVRAGGAGEERLHQRRGQEQPGHRCRT